MPVWLRTLIFTAIVPGTFAVYVPVSIIVRDRGAYSPAGGAWWLGLVPLALGVAGYFWCAWDFMVAGRGTPFPLDAPRKLVIRGLYRYARNPMYISVLCVASGQAILCASRGAMIYTAALWLMFHLVVLVYEEPTLRAPFGEQYDDYCRRVPRWLPRLR